MAELPQNLLIGRRIIAGFFHDCDRFLISCIFQKSTKNLCNVTESPLEGTLDISKPEYIFILTIRTIFRCVKRNFLNPCHFPFYLHSWGKTGYGIWAIWDANYAWNSSKGKRFTFSRKFRICTSIYYLQDVQAYSSSSLSSSAHSSRPPLWQNIHMHQPSPFLTSANNPLQYRWLSLISPDCSSVALLLSSDIVAATFCFLAIFFYCYPILPVWVHLF